MSKYIRAISSPGTISTGFGGMLLFFAAATILQLPYHFSWYMLHRYLMVPSRLILGWIQLPLRSFVTFLYPIKYIEVVYVAVAAQLGFVLGLLVFFLWTRYRIGKLLVGVFVLSNVVIGGFVSFWLGDFVRTPTEICRIALTGGLSIRVLGYGPQNESFFDNYFILSTVDGGQTWSQALVQYYDIWDENPPPPDCEERNLHYQTLPDNKFIWLWTRENLSISNDGGYNWRSWTPACMVRVQCDYGSITAVTFEDVEMGYMNVVPFINPPGATTDLYSSDGGLTWSTMP
jgi:hypothetical protein